MLDAIEAYEAAVTAALEEAYQEWQNESQPFVTGSKLHDGINKRLKQKQVDCPSSVPVSKRVKLGQDSQ
jgi:hypothetical protein